ncbi:MAG TPA: YCF48-related protein [Acidobacteriota bacterium]|nr:YCF48-related protein [Acidobacteriota bacterium]
MIQLRTLLILLFLSTLTLTAAGQWETVGQVQGGPLTLIRDAVDPQLVWGTSLRGLFLSRDGAMTWGRVDSHVPFPRTVLVDPQASGRAYTTNGIQVYLTEDAGQSWSDCSQGLDFEFGEIEFLTFSPGDPKVLYAGNVLGIFRSQDGSCEWHQVPLTGFGGFIVNALDASSGQLWAAGLSGLYRFDAGSQSWSEMAPLSPVAEARIQVLSFDLEQEGRIWAAGTQGELFRSNDGGDSWMQVGEEVGFLRINQIVFQPNDPPTVFAADQSDLFRSDDDGETWENLTADLEGFGASSVLIDPSDSGVLVAGSNLNGVFHSQDDGQTWMQITQGIRSISVSSLTQAPSNENRLYITTFSGGLLRSDDAGASWDFILPQGAPQALRALLVDPQDDSSLVAAGRGGIYSSLDGGQTWTQVFDQFSTFALHRVEETPQTLLAAGAQASIVVSTDNGATWEAIEVTDENLVVASVSTPASDAETIFAAGDAQVFRSTNGGQDWESVLQIPDDDLSSLVPSTEIVRVSPSDPQVVYATGSSGFFRSRDGGDTWRRVNNEGFPDFLIDPQDPDRILTLDPSESLNGGESFRPVGEGLEPLKTPNFAGLSLDSSGQLLAAADGAYFLRQEGEDRQRFPFFTLGGIPGLPNTSRLFVFNGESAAQARVEARTSDGQEVADAFPGLDETLEPFQVATALSNPDGDLEIGSFTLFSDAPTQASLLFDGTSGMAGFSGPSLTFGGARGLQAPFSNSVEDNRRASVSIRNFSQDAVNVEMDLRDGRVHSLGTASTTIEAGQTLARFLDEFDWRTFEGDPLDVTDVTATLHLQSSGLSKAVMLETLPGDLAQVPMALSFVYPIPAEPDGIAASATSLDVRNAVELPGRASSFAPQIANGAGLQTRIFILNELPAEETVDIFFRDEEGNPVEIDVVGSGPVTEVRILLSATQFTFLRTSGEGPLAVASAEIRHNGLTNIWTQLTGPAGSTADRPAPATAAPFRFPARLNASEQLDTGMAFHNTSEQDNLLSLELLDDQNQSLASAEITLSPRGRISLLVSEIDWQSDQPLDFSDFVGSLRVVPQQEVAATVIQVRPGTFGKIPLALE